MSNLTDFARTELTRAGLFDKDSDYGGLLGNSVMQMVEVFAAAGHSGASAERAILLFERLVNFEPLTPLTGEPDEWVDVGGGLLQNRRCSTIFKDPGRLFGGLPYSVAGKEAVIIEFPYTV